MKGTMKGTKYTKERKAEWLIVQFSRLYFWMETEVDEEFQLVPGGFQIGLNLGAVNFREFGQSLDVKDD
jgi:hypothetical protein